MLVASLLRGYAARWLRGYMATCLAATWLISATWLRGFLRLGACGYAPYRCVA